MKKGHSLSLLLAVAASAVLAAPGYSQPAVPRSADLPLTRLQGAPASGGPVARQQPVPPAPGELSSLPVTQLDDRASTPDLDGPRRIALSLARPLPLRDMLLLLVNGTPFSIVTDDSVGGTFVGDLKDLTMRQALEAVLFPRGLDYDVQGGLIRIASHKPSTRLYEVNILNERRTVQQASRSITAPDGGQPAASEVSTAGGSDRLEDLGRGVQALLSDIGRMHVDRTSGLVQVTDFDERLDRVANYLQALQLRAGRQVRIEAQVFEVTLTDPTAMSIDWKAAAARGAGSGGAAGGLAAGMKIHDPAAFLQALGAQGRVEMIAAPQVLAMNNEPAIVRVGTERVYFDVRSRQGAGRPQQTATPGSVLEGFTLTVIPQIAGDGTVQLSVAPTYTGNTGEAKSPVGGIYPVLRVSQADTNVRVRDGDTIVFSGFLRDRTRTRPGTGLGSYFGAQAHETVRSELVVLLTPTIVTPGGTSAATLR